jgi:hypothetical protein
MTMKRNSPGCEFINSSYGEIGDKGEGQHQGFSDALYAVL